jgi:hypothetical protein
MRGIQQQTLITEPAPRIWRGRRRVFEDPVINGFLF